LTYADKQRVKPGDVSLLFYAGGKAVCKYKKYARKGKGGG